MKIEGKEYRTIWFDEEKKIVKIIDQTKLPHQFIIKELKTVNGIPVKYYNKYLQLKLWKLEVHL